jgi:hypothetical protein
MSVYKEVKIDHDAQKNMRLPKTILAIVDNQLLRKTLVDWASNNSCHIHFGDPNGSDIYAVGAFVTIVDRTLLGQEVYDYYLQWCNGTMGVMIVEEAISDSHGNREVVWQCKDEVKLSKLIHSWRDEFCDDVCIFIDNLLELALPATKLVHVINPTVPNLDKWVLNIVGMAHKEVFKTDC